MEEKLVPKEIKKLIDEYNQKIVNCFYPNQFTLNNQILEITNEITRLQKLCEHEFQDGYCIYCYSKEEK